MIESYFLTVKLDRFVLQMYFKTMWHFLFYWTVGTEQADKKPGVWDEYDSSDIDPYQMCSNHPAKCLYLYSLLPSTEDICQISRTSVFIHRRCCFHISPSTFPSGSQWLVRKILGRSQTETDVFSLYSLMWSSHRGTIQRNYPLWNLQIYQTKSTASHLHQPKPWVEVLYANSTASLLGGWPAEAEYNEMEEGKQKMRRWKTHR